MWVPCSTALAFSCEFTLSAEDDDSSIVLLRGRLSGLLFRL